MPLIWSNIKRPSAAPTTEVDSADVCLRSMPSKVWPFPVKFDIDAAMLLGHQLKGEVFLPQKVSDLNEFSSQVTLLKKLRAALLLDVSSKYENANL